MAGFAFEGIRIDQPHSVLVGLLAGGTIAFLFSSLAIRAGGPRGSAGRRGSAQPVPRQSEHHGLLGQTRLRARGRHLYEDNRSASCSTPGLLAVLSPIIAGFLLKEEALGRVLAGAIVTTA